MLIRSTTQFTVSSPGDQPELDVKSLGLLRSRNSSTMTCTLHLDDRVIRDPFGVLPVELIYSILLYLPRESLQDFVDASWPIHSLTHQDAFWRQLIVKDMPWFWELHHILRTHGGIGLDLRHTYSTAMTATQPKFGVQGPLIGVANRRRLWEGPCQALAWRYFDNLPKSEVVCKASKPDKSLFESSHNLQLPAVHYPPQFQGAKTLSSPWVQSWEEIDSKSIVFEASWNGNGALIGLSIAFGDVIRKFSVLDLEENSVRSKVQIPSEKWIEGIILHLNPVDYPLEDSRNDKGHSYTSVKGITVCTWSEKLLPRVSFQGHS